MTQLINEIIEAHISLLKKNVSVWNEILTSVTHKINNDDSAAIYKAYYINPETLIEIVTSHPTSKLRTRNTTNSYNGHPAPKGHTYFNVHNLTIPTKIIFAQKINPVQVSQFIRKEIKKQAVARTTAQIEYQKKILKRLDKSIRETEAATRRLERDKATLEQVQNNIQLMEAELTQLTQ